MLSSGLIFGFIAMYRMLWLGSTWNWLALLCRYFWAMSGGGAAKSPLSRLWPVRIDCEAPSGW